MARPIDPYKPKPSATTGQTWAQRAAAAQARANASRAANAGNRTPQQIIAATPARQALTAQGIANPTIAQINAANRGYVGVTRQNNAAARNPVTPKAPGIARTGGGGSRGGGGGGGGAALPQYSQAQLDWMQQLLAAGGPKAPAALDLPDYQAYTPKAFDDSYFSGLQGSLNQAVNTDLGTAQQGTNDLMSFLQRNYSNAFNNPNSTYATAGQAPGMDQASMARMLSQQGVNPQQAMGQQQQAAATADAGFTNLWRTLAGNEDRNQQNRLGAAQMGGTDAANRIRALGLGGTTGINMQKGQAKSAYDQRVEQWQREDAAQQQQIAQQEAMSNWQAQNQYGEQSQQYRNAQIQALLGLLPELKGTALNMPTPQSLGWG